MAVGVDVFYIIMVCDDAFGSIKCPLDFLEICKALGVLLSFFFLIAIVSPYSFLLSLSLSFEKISMAEVSTFLLPLHSSDNSYRGSLFSSDLGQ